MYTIRTHYTRTYVRTRQCECLQTQYTWRLFSFDILHHYVPVLVAYSHACMMLMIIWFEFSAKIQDLLLFGEYNPRSSICGRFKKLVQNLNRVNLANSIYKRSYRWSVSSGMYVGVDHWEHMFMFLLDPSLLFVIFV